jgi:2Fe-2S ferredoxin
LNCPKANIEGKVMVKIIFEDTDGTRREVDVEPGGSVMQAAVNNSIPGIEAACGGCLVCGTCHASIPDPWFSTLPPPSEMEADVVENGLYVDPYSRMMCQIKITVEMDGMLVVTPPSQR